jgi:hypothetical protein
LTDSDRIPGTDASRLAALFAEARRDCHLVIRAKAGPVMAAVLDEVRARIPRGG